MRSPMYWNGLIYRASMHVLHGSELKKRYAHIRKLIEPGESVLDVGCGTGTLHSYLKDNEYLGLDLNSNFVKYAKKKKRNVIEQDALTFDRYREFDVCIVMDVLHHITPKHEKFVSKILREVQKKVILCEPMHIPGRHPLHEKLISVLDDDGTNTPEKWMTEPELYAFYKKFKPARIDKISQGVIAYYEKKK